MKKLISLSLTTLLLASTVACSSAVPDKKGAAASNPAASNPTVSSSEAESTGWKPEKDINVVVAYKAGSGTDTGARILCAAAEKYTGKTLVVVNKEGADGKIGYTELANAKPDGYTIGFINLPTYASLATEDNSPFKEDSITPICNHLAEPSCVVVRKDSQFNTIEDLVKYCQEHPSEIKCSTNGEKASNHIGIQLLAKMANFEVTNVPYGGTADQLLALRQGEVDISVPKVGDVSSLIGENGELKMLATYTEKRLDDYPDVPTLKEKGYDLIYGSYRALVGPKEMPQEMVDFYAKAFKDAMEDPDNIEKSKNAGLTVNYMGQEDLTAFIHSQFDFVNTILPDLF